MTCQRCEGLMVLERYDDLELGSAGYEVSAWRCLNCGAIVDSVIAAHHQPANKTGPDPLYVQQLKKLVMTT
jgi:RNase P subunit RPR2